MPARSQQRTPTGRRRALPHPPGVLQTPSTVCAAGEARAVVAGPLPGEAAVMPGAEEAINVRSLVASAYGLDLKQTHTTQSSVLPLTLLAVSSMVV
jgi:hypothetical protein